MNVAAYPKYESYKDSGIQWIGAIPEHWLVERSKWLFHDRKERARKGEPQLAATQKYGVIPQTEFMELESRRITQVFLDFTILKHVEAGDFVMSMRSFQGGLEYSKYTGSVSSAYVALAPQNTVHAPFYKYLLKSQRYIEALQATSNLVRDGQALRFENFSMVDLFAPPLPEQRAIAAFLDGKCAKIDEAVRIKEEQIRLLAERRQILIQQAVTRGLNPDAPMKDSGVDWIGQIPAHWAVRQLKHLVSEPLKYGANEEARDCINGDPRYIRITDFGSDGRLREETKRTLPRKIAQDYLLRVGDILLARSGGTVGKSFFFTESIEACFAGYLIMARSNLNLIKSAYLNTFFRSPSFEHWKELIFSRATIQNIGADKYGALLIPLPPIKEQVAIQSHVDEVNQKLDDAIALKQSQITTLREYKTSLINAAVTGKIKVI